MAWWSRVVRWFGPSGLDQGRGEQSPLPTAYPYRAQTNVTVDSALQLSSVWACARLLAETVASLPLNVYQTRAGDVPLLATDSDLYRVLHDRPNSMMTSLEFREAMMLNLVLMGNAYARIQRRNENDLTSEVVGLWPIPASQISPEVMQDGTLVYVQTNETGTKVWSQERILHIKLFGNGLVGLSPLGYARNAMSAAIAMDERASVFFANGGKPSGVLMVDKVLTPEQRTAIRAQFSELEAGNDDKLFVLEAGAKYQQTSISPQDAQLLESRRFQLEDICRFFGVPSFLVNDTEKTTTWGSGIEQMMLGFYTLTLRPYLERWEAACNARLLTPRQRTQGFYVEFDFDALLRADMSGRAAFYSQMVQNGILSRNEVRARENLPPFAGGDAYTAQVNMAPVGSLGAGNGTQTPGA
jgi:HK97 family phage portal protein